MSLICLVLLGLELELKSRIISLTFWFGMRYVFSKLFINFINMLKRLDKGINIFIFFFLGFLCSFFDSGSWKGISFFREFERKDKDLDFWLIFLVNFLVFSFSCFINWILLKVCCKYACFRIGIVIFFFLCFLYRSSRFRIYSVLYMGFTRR